MAMNERTFKQAQADKSKSGNAFTHECSDMIQELIEGSALPKGVNIIVNKWSYKHKDFQFGGVHKVKVDITIVYMAEPLMFIECKTSTADRRMQAYHTATLHYERWPNVTRCLLWKQEKKKAKPKKKSPAQILADRNAFLELEAGTRIDIIATILHPDIIDRAKDKILSILFKKCRELEEMPKPVTAQLSMTLI